MTKNRGNADDEQDHRGPVAGKSGLLLAGLSLLALSTWLILPSDENQTQETSGTRYPAIRAPRGPGDPPDSSSALSGRVLDDKGAPIAAASVCAFSSVEASLATHRCVATDASGVFALSQLSSGVYFVHASALGFLPSVANGAAAIHLAENTRKDGVDMVLRGGGTSVSGLVVDATGGPVAHAGVQIVGGGTPRARVRGETDDEGRFALSMPPGEISLTAWADGYTVGYLNWVAPASGVQLVLMPQATVAGTVVTYGDGKPVEGVVVSALPTTGMGRPSEPSLPSDSEGHFLINGVTPGSYVLSAEGDHVQGRSLEPVMLDVADSAQRIWVVVSPCSSVRGRVFDRATSAACSSGHVRMFPAEDATVELPTLSAIIESDGRVTFPGVPPGRYAVDVYCRDKVLLEGPSTLDVSNRDLADLQWKVGPGLGLSISVVDQRGEPVPYAHFSLQLPQPPDAAPGVMIATTDERGYYEYAATLRPGTYVISPHGHTRGEPTTVELREGMGKVDARLKLAGTASITVSVKGSDGEAVEGITLVATSVGRAKTGNPVGDGRYRVGPLEPGRYRVSIEDGTNPPSIVGGTDSAVVVREGNQLELSAVLERSASISGRVVDAAGEPKPNVWVTASYDAPGAELSARLTRSLGGERRVLTDLEGRFRVDRLSSGSLFLLRAEELSGSTTQQSRVPTGSDVTLRLDALGTLRGSAFGSNGKPLAQTSIQLSVLETGWTRAIFVKPDGSWEFANVSPGRLFVSAMDEAGRHAAREVDLGPGQTLDDVRLILQDPSPTPPEVGEPSHLL
ncbi:MAG: carboxypeptidase-like regulatory domain-containing protein [Myxococcales bacterium]